MQQQGFRSILARLETASETPVSAAKESKPETDGEKRVSVEPVADPAPDIRHITHAPVHYELVQDAAHLRRWVEAARAQGYVAIDTETKSLTPSTTLLVGVSMATAPGKACYVPLNHVDPASTPNGFAFEDAKAPKQIGIKDLVAAR